MREQDLSVSSSTKVRTYETIFNSIEISCFEAVDVTISPAGNTGVRLVMMKTYLFARNCGLGLESVHCTVHPEFRSWTES